MQLMTLNHEWTILRSTTTAILTTGTTAAILCDSLHSSGGSSLLLWVRVSFDRVVKDKICIVNPSTVIIISVRDFVVQKQMTFGWLCGIHQGKKGNNKETNYI
jgi:hypothetical protein